MEQSNGSNSKRVGTAFLLNLSFTVIELIGGILTGSIAIIADAVHDFSDSLSLGVSWYMEKKSEKKPNTRFPFGYKRFSLLGALISGAVLVFGSVYVLYEAGKRLMDPVSPHASGMMWIAILGIIVNGFAAFKLKGGSAMNTKVLTWHLFEDVLGWAAVLVVSIILQFKDIPVLDPLLSIGLTLFIVTVVLKKLKQTLMIFLESAPEDINVDELKGDILKIEGVAEVEEMRVWSIDGKEHAAMVHLLTERQNDTGSKDKPREEVRKLLENRDITFATIELNKQ